MRLQQNIEYRNRRGTDYVIINRFDTSKRNWKIHPSVFWKKSFLNVVQKCFQHVEGVSSKYPKISRKNLAKEYWVLLKKGQRQNLWAPLEEKRFLEFFRYNEFLSRPSRGNPLNGCRRRSWDCNRILSIITTRQIFFRWESAESRRNFTNMRLKLLTKNRKSCIAP